MGCVTRERMATEKEQKMMGRGPGSVQRAPHIPCHVLLTSSFQVLG